MIQIENIPSNVKFSKFFSMKMKLTWLENTRFEIVVDISQIAQVAQAMYEKI